MIVAPSNEQQPSLVACADIGGSFIKLALADSTGQHSDIERVPTPVDDFNDFCKTLSHLLSKYEKQLAPTASLCLSITGLIDPDTHKMVCANIPCLSGRNLVADLEQALARPVLIANDGDCFAFSEAINGAGRGYRVVFGAILGTGVGGGLVVEGQLARGPGGVGGEWGHGAIVPTTTRNGLHIPHFRCGCGKTGCLDTVGSARGLERLDHFLHQHSRDSREILGCWEARESNAVKTVNVYLELVAEPLAFVVNVTGAGIIVLGGGLSSNLALVSALNQAVQERLLNPKGSPAVVPAYYPSDGGLRGAALLAQTDTQTRLLTPN